MIVIGDYIKDKYIIGTSDRLSPEAPVPVVKPLFERIFDGGAGNVVANLKAMGHSNLLFICNPNQKITKTRIIADNHLICRIDDEEYEPYNVDLDQYHIDNRDIAIISDYNKGVVDNPEHIIRQLSLRNIKAFVDPKKSFSNYAGAFLIKVNQKEFEKEVKASYYDHSAGIFCEKLCEDYYFSYVVITLGADGCYVYDHISHKGLKIHSDRRTVLDVTGAGDVFIASLAHFYIKGHTIPEAAKMANKLAGISVSHTGTYVITKEDLDSVEKKQTVVFTNGCFDILHRGHFELLEKSKAMGHKLVVGLNSDASVRRLKGPNRPYFSQKDRKIALEAIYCVDEVIIFDEDTPYDLIKKIKPDIITKGGDYTTKTVIGNDLTKVVIIPTLEGYSSTGVIDAIRR
jgi:D-beta-D-heptose 7-phosphate kinase/D-beta-D-heptose 1-phosphate adenosyltransferase